MKYATLATIGLGIVVASTPARAQEPKAKAEPELKTMEQKISYSLGQFIGRDFKQKSLTVDTTTFSQGLKDALAEKSLLTDGQIAEAMQAFQQQMMAKQQELMAKQQGGGGGTSALGEKNAKAGQAFLAENKTKPGILTLPSGLQYKVIKEGTGKTPKTADTVEVHYQGTLLDGTKFDSSYDRGQSISFGVTGVIKGWTEILQKMKVGSKYQVFIPSDLAYGVRGNMPDIPPNSTLIFDIELLGVK